LHIRRWRVWYYIAPTKALVFIGLSGNSPTCAADSHVPEVSVIIPAYNVSEYIGEALDTVFRQTFTDYEAIVVNDGSPDTPRLEQILQPYRDRIVYIVQENRGLSGARNTAIRAAKGKYVALLDADDIWEPDYLAVQLDYLRQHPECDLVSCNARFFGDETYGGKEYMKVFPSRGPVSFESLVTRKCNLFVSVTARREAVVNAGLFDEGLRSCEDYDMWLRLAARGAHMGYHDKVLARYRRRESSLSADPVWMAENNIKVLEKMQRSFSPDSSEWKLLEGQRRKKQAEGNYWNGRKAFARGDTTAALEYFRKASEVLKMPKLRAFIFFLRVSPGLMLKIFQFKKNLQSRSKQ